MSREWLRPIRPTHVTTSRVISAKRNSTTAACRAPGWSGYAGVGGGISVPRLSEASAQLQPPSRASTLLNAQNFLWRIPDFWLARRGPADRC